MAEQPLFQLASPRSWKVWAALIAIVTVIVIEIEKFKTNIIVLQRRPVAYVTRVNQPWFEAAVPAWISSVVIPCSAFGRSRGRAQAETVDKVKPKRAE